jgi:deoxyribonuclease IV
MLANGRRIGAHLPLGTGMVKAADRAAEIGASAIQIFSDNPTSWRRRPSLPDELPAFRERLAANGVSPISIHAPYLVNLAGPEPAFFERSCSVLANDMRVAAAYGARILNLHIGSHRGEGPAAGIARLADGLAEVFAVVGDEAPGVMLALENGSGGGFGLGVSIEELVRIEAAVRARGIGPDRFGYCLDTAHLWGAGYAIDTAAGVDDVIAAFDAGLGLDRLLMVHLNDSRSELGSRADRHEHIGAGRIGEAGLARVITHPALAHVPYMLETPGMDDGYDAVNLARVRDLAEGRPLGPLPPEAFLTRSAKGRSAPADPEADAPDADRPRRGSKAPAAIPPAAGGGAAKRGRPKGQPTRRPKAR